MLKEAGRSATRSQGFETSGLIPADTADQSGILEGASLPGRSSAQARSQGFEDPEHLWEQPASRGSNLGYLRLYSYSVIPFVHRYVNNDRSAASRLTSNF